MRTYITGFLLLILFSCEEKKSVAKANSADTSVSVVDEQSILKAETQVPESSVSAGNCYMQTSGRDTVLLQFAEEGNRINGRMKFDNYQIDGSSGTVQGKVKGDLIELWYNFNAEGMHTVRQLLFKRSDERLLWGKGIQKTSGDSTLYKDTAITYSEILFLRKVDCNIVKDRL